MPSFGFIGPAYQTRGIVGESEMLMNLYLERIESDNGAARPTKYQLLPTPGKVLFCQLSDGPIAAIASSTAVPPVLLPTDPYFFAVGGKTLYAIAVTIGSGGLAQGVPTTIGTLDELVIDGTGGQLFPVQMIVLSPVQVFLVSPNGKAYIAGFGSAITGSAVNSGGLGYAAGDTGIIMGSLVASKYTVTSVDGSGAVLTYSLSGGTGYSVSTNNQTQTGGSQPGAGAGFSIDISSVAAAAWLLYNLSGTDYNSAINNLQFVQSCTFLDGYIIISLAPNDSEPNRRTFYVSGLNDPNTWSLLDFAEKESKPDPIIGVYAAYEILHVMGAHTSELWQNTGNALFPLQRLPGSGVIDVGLVNQNLICTMDGTIVWMAQDSRGAFVAYQMQGATPIRISNFAIENHWANFNMAGASCYSYQENGHVFAVFHFPINDETWVYDSTLGPAIGWHQRAHWDGARFHVDNSRYHGYTPDLHIVGDPNEPNLYIQSMRFLDDNCECIRRIRICPHEVDEKKWTIFDRFRMHMLTGKCPPTLSPVCSLRISNDGGYSWSPYLDRSMGLTGEYEKMVEWYHLGRSRDRVFEWSMCEPIDIVLVEAYIELRRGTG